MHFLARRYRYALGRRLAWAWLVLLPPLVYLGLSARRVESYTVRQRVAVPPEAPLASSHDPVGVLALERVLEQPDLYLVDDTALQELHAHIFMDSRQGNGNPPMDASVLRALVANSLALEPAGDGAVALTYRGPDRPLGETLVGFYAQRFVARVRAGYSRQRFQVVERIEEGMGRTRVRFSRDEEAPEPASQSVNVRLQGERHTEEVRAAWRSDRLVPSLLALAGAAVLFLLGVALLEAFDPAIKSERHAARYLDLPILGGVPKLGNVSARLRGP